MEARHETKMVPAPNSINFLSRTDREIRSNAPSKYQHITPIRVILDPLNPVTSLGGRNIKKMIYGLKARAGHYTRLYLLAHTWTIITI